VCAWLCDGNCPASRLMSLMSRRDEPEGSCGGHGLVQFLLGFVYMCLQAVVGLWIVACTFQVLVRGEREERRRLVLQQLLRSPHVQSMIS
jgi:hypothetical protein